jgi:tyrosine-protein kinase Etk/Wzc
LSYQDILNTIVVYKNILIKVTVFSGIFLFLILFFIYPITYSSVVKILPPDANKNSVLGNLINNNDLTNLMNPGFPGSNSQLFAEILKSRTSAEYVIRNCRLMNYLSVKDTQLAAEKLMKSLDVEVSKEGIISLSVDVATPLFSRFSSAKDSIRNLSSRISNAYVEALDKINQEKLNSHARHSKEFVEKQLLITKANLDAAEDSLRNFQETNKAISLSEQLTASIQTAAKIKSDIILTEIQIGTLSSNLMDNNNTLEGLTRKLEELKKQYAQIEAGEKLGSDYMPSFSNVPRLSLELAKLYREVRIQNDVYSLLQKQFYSEKIQENKDIPTVEVLDKAMPPLKAKSPRLIYHTLLGSLFIFLLMCCIILYQENKKYEHLKTDGG